MKTPARGFTLIEILVVIAIIGILTTAVLASLRGARGQGNDTGVKADLATIQVQATLYYGIGNTYGAAGNTSCAGTGTVFNDTGTTLDQPIQNAVASAQKDVSGGASNLICHSNSSAFMVAGKLSTNKYWCVDWKGAALEKSAAPGGSATDCGY